MNFGVQLNQKQTTSDHDLIWTTFRKLTYTQTSLEKVIKKIYNQIRSNWSDYSIVIKTKDRTYCYTGEMIKEIAEAW